MNETLQKARELKSAIDELPEMKEYLHLKKLMEENEELKQIRKDIARLSSQGKIIEKNNLLEIYNSHPLVNNYSLAKEEIKLLLEEIKKIIE